MFYFLKKERKTNKQKKQEIKYLKQTWQQKIKLNGEYNGIHYYLTPYNFYMLEIFDNKNILN